MSVEIDARRCREVAEAIRNAWLADGILGDRFMPEDLVPEGMSAGSSEHALFLTLAVSIDYMRNADLLWAAARSTYEDPETRYLFNPILTVSTGVDKVINDLGKYKLVKKPHKDSQIWMTICRTLCRHFNGKVEPLLAEGRWCGPEIIELIRGRTYRYGFPNLKGMKIVPLWVRMLNDNWKGHEFLQMDEVELPVDVHTAAATVMLGCIRGNYQGKFSHFSKLVHEAWRLGCRNTSVYPLQLDEPLWHLSRNGCRNRKQSPCEHAGACPVGNHCADTYLQTYGSGGQTPNEVHFETGRWVNLRSGQGQ